MIITTLRRIIGGVFIFVFMSPLFTILLLDTNNMIIIILLSIISTTLYILACIGYDKIELKNEAKKQLKIEQYKQEYNAKNKNT